MTKISLRSKIVAAAAIIIGWELAAGTQKCLATELDSRDSPPFVLRTDAFKRYIDAFNANDNELYKGDIPNATAWDFLKNNIPLLDCPDKGIEQIYYFRWWSYRKHIQNTPVGFIISEFLPQVNWAGRYNSISCAAGHHMYEGRWLTNPKFIDDYSIFWFRKGGEPRRYSFWAADSVWARYVVSGNAEIPKDLLPDLVSNYEAWEKTHLGSNGLFWQDDDRDGMELSAGGKGFRATINSYMYGDATAIANIADLSGNPDISKQYRAKAASLKKLVQEKLWDQEGQFFKVWPAPDPGQLTNKLTIARELHGYTPWYFNLPDGDKSAAWKQLMDPQAFYAPYGPTTAEQQSPSFAVSYAGHECQWNGPSWPFATSVTLTAMANLLNNYQQEAVSRRDYFDLLKIYTRSQRLKRTDGRIVPWIDENLNPRSGEWISRTLLIQRGSKIPERGKDYNHSTYCDLIITGLVGLRPNATDIIVVNPLIPDDEWDYFCLDNIRYHGRRLTILYDKTGGRYHRGTGLRVLADGTEIGASATRARLTCKLNERASLKKGIAAWRTNDIQNASLVGATWAYNWRADMPTLPAEVEYVPMKWSYYGESLAEITNWVVGLKNAGARILLAFNEPESGPKQANLTVALALQGFDYLYQGPLPVISPAAAEDTGSWMKEFMAGAAAQGKNIPIVAVHSYITNANAFLAYIDECYRRHGRPLWITEFAPSDWKTPTTIGVDDCVAFINTVLPGLEGRAYVERYSWYLPPSGPTSGELGTAALFNSDNTLTEVGERYKNPGAPFTPDGYTWRLVNRASQNCLDNYGATVSGSRVFQYSPGSITNQRWRVTKSGAHYKLQCVTRGLYLDTLGNTASGSLIGQGMSSGSSNQLWHIASAGFGYFKISSAASGKCLDSLGSTTNGSAVGQWSGNESDNQKWMLIGY